MRYLRLKMMKKAAYMMSFFVLLTSCRGTWVDCHCGRIVKLDASGLQYVCGDSVVTIIDVQKGQIVGTVPIK
jgi:hypothetical protein